MVHLLPGSQIVSQRPPSHWMKALAPAFTCAVQPESEQLRLQLPAAQVASAEQVVKQRPPQQSTVAEVPAGTVTLQPPAQQKISQLPSSQLSQSGESQRARVWARTASTVDPFEQLAATRTARQNHRVL